MANPLARAQTFIAGVREELRQVSWPTREELVGSVLVVFVGIALLGGFISIVDFILSKLVHGLLQ